MKILIDINIDSFINKLDFQSLDKIFDNEIDEKLSSFVDKFKHIEHYLENIVVKFVVSNEYKANENFKFNDISYFYDLETIYRLRKIVTKYPDLKDRNVSLIFIVDDNSNNDLHSIYDIELHYLRHEIFRKSSYIIFENSLDKEPSYYVKNARKSVLNSLYSMNMINVYRQSDKYISIENIRDQLDNNKYISLKCPICVLKDSNSKKFEITKDTIADIITIERSSNKISFNCLHELLDIDIHKFYFSPEKYDIEMSNYSDDKLQIWTLKNFDYIVKKEMQNGSYRAI